MTNPSSFDYKRREKPKLLFIGNFLVKRIRPQTLDLARQLEGRGYDMLFASSYETQSIRLLHILSTALFWSSQYDIVIIDTFDGKAFTFAFLVAQICHVLHKPVVHIIRSGSFHKFILQREKTIYNLFIKAYILLSPGRSVVSSLKAIGLDAEYLPNGIDLNEYPWTERMSARPRLLWLRSFHPIYDPIMAIEAFALVYAQYPSAKLTMAGQVQDEKLFQRVKRRATSLGVAHAVEFPGFVPPSRHVDLAYKHDIFLCTTRYESFGMSNIQAGALGLCLVLTNVGEIPEIWSDGINADLVQAGDAHGMAKACINLINFPTLVKQRSFEARKNAERFSWSNIVPLWENVLLRVGVQS